MKRSTPRGATPAYVRRAKRRFLEGLWHRSPVEAVLAGKRTLEEWADLLEFEREREATLSGQRARQPRKPARDLRIV
jgi:hypothetical protein